MIELDRHIEILLLSNDCVIIPNFGGLMAHYVEARKDDRDSAFLPPMRTIGFNPKLRLNDSLLAQSYVEAYDISYPEAVARIEDEVRELRQHLDNDGAYELKDIGLLRLSDSGLLEFEPCDAGILTPALYGLGHFSMKTLAQMEREQAEQASGAGVVATAELRPLAQPAAPAMLTEEAFDDDEPVRSRRWVAFWRNTAVACAAGIAFLLVPTPLANNRSAVMESRVNTALLDYVTPKEYTKGGKSVEEAAKAAVRSRSSLGGQRTPSGTQRATSAARRTSSVTAQPTAQDGYTIVLASKVSARNATAYIRDLHRRGYDEAKVLSRNGNNQVVVGRYANEQEARKALSTLRRDKEFGEAWIMKY